MKACVTRAQLLWHYLFLLIASSLLIAQTQTFDVASFTAPAGWAATQDRDHVTFTFIDNAAKTFVMLAVYSSTPGTGDTEKDFAGEWADIVGRSFSAGNAPRSAAGQSRSGLRFREGAAQVKQGNGQPAFVRLMVFPAEKRRFSVMLVGSNEKALAARQAATQAFVDSLKLVAPGAASLPVTATSNSAASGPGAAPRPGKGISGVWMGFKTYTGDYEPHVRWYTFYDDGQVFEDIPRSGFAGFNRSASQADSGQRNYWGTYTFANGAGAINKPGVKFSETLLSEGAGKLKIDSAHFYQCQSVDGLRLQGAWTSLGNPNDPELDRWPVGQRPIFRFTSDGKFVDEGVFATFIKSGDPRQDSAGNGTYEIHDFALILHFSDGRVKQLAITGMLSANAANSNDTLYFGRSAFHKRK